MVALPNGARRSLSRHEACPDRLSCRQASELYPTSERQHCKSSTEWEARAATTATEIFRFIHEGWSGNGVLLWSFLTSRLDDCQYPGVPYPALTCFTEVSASKFMLKSAFNSLVKASSRRLWKEKTLRESGSKGLRFQESSSSMERPAFSTMASGKGRDRRDCTVPIGPNSYFKGTAHAARARWTPCPRHSPWL